MPRRSLPTLLAAALASSVLASACDGGASSAEPSPRAAEPAEPPGLAAASPFADLAADTLVAPAAPTLELRPSPGALTFRWDAPRSVTETVQLIAHDADDGRETTLATLAPGRRELRLPIAPHRLRWGAVSWRVAHCGADGCLSSRRERPEGLAEATFESIRPGVVVADERFGERVALSESGTLLALARPVEGRVELRYALGDGSIAADPLPRLDGPASTTRALDVALSASGDTIAVLGGDAVRNVAPWVAVLERLGEGWFETARFDAFADGSTRIGVGAARPQVALAADGSRLLAACRGTADCPLVVHELADVGWRVAARLDGTPSDATPLAVAASAALDRVAIVTAGTDGAGPRLRLHDAALGWRAHRSVALASLDADAPVAIALDARGTHLALGGRAAASVDASTLVLRRQRLALDGDALELVTEDAQRLAGPERGRPFALSLAADAALDTIAFGWRTAHDATLVTRVRRDGRWAPALALPDAAATFAKRPFGGALAVAADGGTLAFDVPASAADPATAPRSGRVALLRARDGGATLGRPATFRTPGP